MDKDGFISNGELFQVLKTMAGSNLKDWELQQVVDKTIISADQDGDGRICFQEFRQVRRTGSDSVCSQELLGVQTPESVCFERLACAPPPRHTALC